MVVARRTEVAMMDGFMNGSGSMMWGTGPWGIAVVVLVALGVAALTKYLFFNNRR